MAHLLSHQEDFVNQILMLEQLITSCGHLCIFLPKFHCELNPIEMVCVYINCASATISSSTTKYWGWAKYRYRQVIKLTFELAKIATLDALNSCPLNAIHHFIN